MNLLSFEWAAGLYLIAAVCFILALKGLSSPKTARRGNLIGALGALIALVTVFLSMKIDNLPWILLTIAVGSAIAAPVSRRVQMTQMPQLVALFNGVGGSSGRNSAGSSKVNGLIWPAHGVTSDVTPGVGM